MHRTNIYLEDEQCSTLDALARSTGISRAEVIRRLIDQAMASESQDLDGDVLAIEESFGALADDERMLERGPDGRMQHLQDIAGG